MAEYEALGDRLETTRSRILATTARRVRLLHCLEETLAMISRTEETIVRTDILIADLREALVGAVP